MKTLHRLFGVIFVGLLFCGCSRSHESTTPSGTLTVSNTSETFTIRNTSTGPLTVAPADSGTLTVSNTSETLTVTNGQSGTLILK